MSRDLTAAALAELTAAAITPVLFAEMDFASGFVRAHTAIGDIAWNGYTWTGIGSLGAVSAVGESADFRAHGAQLQLSGVPTSLMSIALGEDYQGRAATLWLGFLDSAGALIDAPVKLLAGRMDTMEIVEGAETATIGVAVESRAVSLKRSRERRWTHEEQQTDYPGDKGFEFVASLQDRQLTWRPT